jgi:tetratricopeptide (TPR) repeat protein
MVLFKKLHSGNKKLASSKLFVLIFVLLLLVLGLGSAYILLPEEKIKALIPQNLIPANLNFLQGDEKAKTLDPKYQQYEVALKKVFENAYDNPHQAVVDLENFKNLPKLLQNRKNYVLMTLYQKLDEPAMAFVRANQISRNYLPKHVLYKKAQMAKKIGLEAIVVEELLYLTNKFPEEPKFEYELAKSYSRQSMNEEAKKHFLSIQKVFPESDYAIGSEYYLANLAVDQAETKKRLVNYLQKSPAGNLSNLVSEQLLASSKADSLTIKKLSNYIAISYHNIGQYKTALKYFNPDLDRPELFLKAYAESLYKTGQKSEARQALIKYLPRINMKEDAVDLIEYLVSIGSKSQAIANLRTLKETVLENIKDKVLWELAKKTHAKEDYMAVYSNFPESFYAAESMAKVFWTEYKRDNYIKVQELAKKHWALYPYANSHPYVAFWSAKALKKQGKNSEAKEVFDKLVNEHPHHYYSYRARQLQKGVQNWFKMPPENLFVTFPNWNWPKVYTDEEVVAEYGADILELTKINQFDYLLEIFDLDKLSKKFKMFLLANSGNYIQAIRTAFFSIKHQQRPNHKDIFFQYAFPLAYADLVSDRAGKNKRVDPMLVHSLIRQESFYQKDIISKVGAVGLMQLMPYTAKSLARQLNMRPPRKYDLMQPKTNITLGVRYMEQVFLEFDNNMINAIASYNAGPGAVKKWTRKYSFSDPDLYVESIPYEETRNYVKQVLNNYWIYRELYS